MPEKEKLILKPFNKIFFALLFFFASLLIVSSILLARTSIKTRETVLLVVSVITFLEFFVYKYFLSIDKEYSEIYADTGGFNIWGEFPIQLCNINMIFIPVAILTHSKPLMAFAFFVGPLGAFMAVAMPCRGFEKYSILLPRMIGFYSNHFMIIIESLALVTFGLYRPIYPDVPRVVIILFFVSLGVYLINMILRKTGLHPRANYFYNIETDGNPVLDMFWKWIPHPFLYQLPCIVVLAAYVFVIMTIHLFFVRMLH